LAEGEQITGTSMHEYEGNERGHRTVHIGGREFLAEVASGIMTGNLPIGARLLCVPLMPAALGGRLASLAKLYEEHRLEHFRVVYVPCVPTTTEGAFIMSFHNDMGTPTIVTGRTLVEEVSSRKSIQTPYWERATLDINPADAMLEYFDQTNGSMRSECQGLLECVTAGQTLSNGGIAWGNLYLEYSLKYKAPDLTVALTPIPTFSMTIRFTNGLTIAPEGNNIKMHGPTGIGNSPLVSIVGGGELTESTASDYMIYGRISAISDVVENARWTWSLRGDQTSREFEVGQLLWFRAFRRSISPLEVIYSVNASALGADLVTGDDEVGNETTLYWNQGVTATALNIITLDARAFKTDNP
jgi:hypothetical protein